MDSGVNIGNVDSYVTLTLSVRLIRAISQSNWGANLLSEHDQIEVGGELSFEYAIEDVTPRVQESNGLQLLINGEVTDLPYNNRSPRRRDETSHPEWRSYSRQMSRGETVIVWNYHQDIGDAGASRVSILLYSYASLILHFYSGHGATSSNIGSRARRGC